MKSLPSESALLALLEAPESQYLERKETCPRGGDLRKTICAFANSTPEDQTSVLFVGVTDKGEVKGVARAEIDQIQRTIQTAGSEECYPVPPSHCESNSRATLEHPMKKEAFIRFSPDILRRLGEELNPNPDKGILELAKNAFDADALNCTITLINTDKNGGTILISDDGDGMDVDEIMSGWLVLGKSTKSAKKKTRLGRTPSGSKGLVLPT